MAVKHLISLSKQQHFKIIILNKDKNNVLKIIFSKLYSQSLSAILVIIV